MQHINSKIENLKALINNKFTTIRRSTKNFKDKKLYYCKYVPYKLFERRGGLSKKRKYN